MAAALSPDGRTLATDLLGLSLGAACFWGACKQISDKFGDIRQPAWSPDGKWIAFQSNAGHIA